MKRLIYMLLSALVLVGCSVQNRIVVTENEEDGLKKIRLVQSPEARVESAKTGQYGALIKDFSAIYLLEEKTASRPLMTLEMVFTPDTKAGEAKGTLVMVLDKEQIPLNFQQSLRDSLHGQADSPAGERLEQKYLIPENLWPSMVHANEISYRIVMEEKPSVHIFLNQKEKDMLGEFLKMAMRQRDLRFPAVPEGQVKW